MLWQIIQLIINKNYIDNYKNKTMVLSDRDAKRILREMDEQSERQKYEKISDKGMVLNQVRTFMHNLILFD